MDQLWQFQLGALSLSIGNAARSSLKWSCMSSGTKSTSNWPLLGHIFHSSVVEVSGHTVQYECESGVLIKICLKEKRLVVWLLFGWFVTIFHRRCMSQYRGSYMTFFLTPCP